MIEYSGLPQTDRLVLEQNLLQRVNAECAQEHTGCADDAGQEEQPVLWHLRSRLVTTGLRSTSLK
jgi:hypothetical protein